MGYLQSCRQTRFGRPQALRIRNRGHCSHKKSWRTLRSLLAIEEHRARGPCIPEPAPSNPGILPGEAAKVGPLLRTPILGAATALWTVYYCKDTGPWFI